MHDSAACSHELQVSRLDCAFVSSEVFMVDGSRKQVCDCFLSPVWVIRKAGSWSYAKVIEHYCTKISTWNLCLSARDVCSQNGVKLRNSRVPIERRTLAPAPSACSTASKTLWMPRGEEVAEFSEGSLGGITGSPRKVVAAAIVLLCWTWRLGVVVVVDDVLMNGLIEESKASRW